MATLLERVLSIGSDPADDPDLRVRKRTGVATTFALIVAASAYAIVGAGSRQVGVMVVSLAQIVGLVLNLVVFDRTRRLAHMVVTIVVFGLATIASGLYTFGGLDRAPTNAVWGLLAPIAGVLLIGGRAALPAYLALVVVVIGSAWLAPVVPAPPALPSLVERAIIVLNLLGPAAVALGLVVFIDGERLRARRESEALLLNILPKTIAERLKAGERVIADYYSEASVLFCDVVGFTPFAEGRAPSEVVATLNDLFTGFDRLAEERGLEKIKTIGDAYMVAAGVPVPRNDHAVVMVEMALAMRSLVERFPAVGGHALQVRIGIASGPLIAGVIGERKFSYDLWGDTVNTASRMESSGMPGCIQITEATFAALAGHYPFQRREGVAVKGKGRMMTWLLNPSAPTEHRTEC